MVLVGAATNMGLKRNKGPLGTSSHRTEDNIKTDLKGKVWYVWTELI
jgi:hypothetical protein